MTESLLPYQEIGAKFLAERKGALLADAMRLGKSAQAIVAADTVKAASILVLCPAIARVNWAREFDKFSPRSRVCDVILSGKQALNPEAHATICSYDLLQNGALFAVLHSRKWDVLILDEAHYLKSITADRSKLVLGKDGLVHRAKHIWALTGTPAPNHAAELYPLLRVLGGYSGAFDAFVSKFCTGKNTPYGFRINGTKNEDELKALLAPVMLRRTKAEVRPELPKTQYSDIVVEPGEIDVGELEQAFSGYISDPRGWEGLTEDVETTRALVAAQFDAAKTEEEKLAILSAMVTKTAMLRRYTGLLKVPAIVELVKAELLGGLSKIVLFGVHRAVIEKLRDGLSDFGAVTLYGGTPPMKRERHLRAFNEDKHTRVFVANIQACGVAISLANGASDAIFVESDWVPMNNAQAAARIDGPHKTETNFVRFAALAGSLDEHVTRTLARKTRELAKIFD